MPDEPTVVLSSSLPDAQPAPLVVVIEQEIVHLPTPRPGDVQEAGGLRRTYLVRATVDGRAVRLRVPAKDFASLRWLTDLGARATLEASREDILRNIRVLPSGEVHQIEHIGWHRLGPGWLVYAHAKGIVGSACADGVTAQASPPSSLANYVLPDQPADLCEVVKEIQAIVPADIGAPLFLAPFAAVVAGREEDATWPAMLIEGGSGSATETSPDVVGLVQWAQSFVAPTSGRSTAAWVDAPDRLRQLAERAHDTVVTFGPPTPAARGTVEAVLDGRMGKHLYPWQAVLVGYGVGPLPPRPYGAEGPHVVSLNVPALDAAPHARLRASLAPAARNHRAALQRSVISWLATQHTISTTQLPESLLKDLEEAELGVFATALAAVLGYGRASDVPEPALNALAGWAVDGLRAMLACQRQAAVAESPTECFRRIVANLLLDGGAHLRPVEGDRPGRYPERLGYTVYLDDRYEARGKHVGWVDEGEGYVWLYGETVYDLAQRRAAQRGLELGTRTGLLRQIKAIPAAGLTHKQGKLTTEKQVRGEPYYGLVQVRLDWLLEAPESAMLTTGQEPLP